MTAPFLDTNILLRHLLNDDPLLAPRCKALIESIERGKQTVWTTDLVIAEVVFVLSNKKTYGVAREGIRDVLLPIISLPGIKLPNKRVYSAAFDLYTSLPISYVDAYHAALIQHQEHHALFSFDTDFDRVRGVVRQES